MKKILLLLVLIPILTYLILSNIRPRPSALSDYLVAPIQQPTINDLTVQFLGNTNIVLSDGHTSIMTDGFFSRPSPFQVLFTDIKPDVFEVKRCLAKAGISKLDAVIPVHSHFDHAMDAPMVAHITGAQLIGSSSTINIGKGYPLSENQMTIPPLNEVVKIGKFKITFIASRHWQYPDAKQRALLLDQDIEAPLTPPASIYDYKEGISYTLFIEHDSTKIAIQGSAGFKQHSIKNLDADILFLAISGIEIMDETYNQNYQDFLIDPLQAEVLVPIHWDDFTVPLAEELKTTNVLFNKIYGSNLGKAFEQIEKRNLHKNRKIKVLPVWKKIKIVELLE